MKQLTVNDRDYNFEHMYNNKFIVGKDVVYFIQDEHIGRIWKAIDNYDGQFLISIGKAIEKQYPELIGK